MKHAALHAWRRIGVFLAFFIGAGCLVQAGWIHAKALAAQVLVAQAWGRARGGETAARPWPWADTQPVARLRLPGAKRSLVVLSGASGRNLAFGPTHDPASVLPGERGNSVIAGHRDTHFRTLAGLKAGDRLGVELPDGRAAEFDVTAVEVIDSRRWRIGLAADSPRLTLVTCYPFGAVDPNGPLRYVITAEKAGDL